MPNIYKIRWTTEANRNLIDIEEYLINKWSEKVAKSFFKKLDSRLEIISRRPLVFPATQHSQHLRRCVLTKQTTIYYLVKSKYVEVISIFDTRQTPDRNPE
ncbi:MAG: type II toxin-antitoxin system RelE/ParE family toxin [Flavobacteriales bacterium]|nr:type II toxin-antitoxin system RelE/ParE family toxin [Flavobacteriales bacterium]